MKLQTMTQKQDTSADEVADNDADTDTSADEVADNDTDTDTSADTAADT